MADIDLIKSLTETYPGVDPAIIKAVLLSHEENERKKIIVNGKDKQEKQGYVTRLKFDAEKKRLSFVLVSASTSIKTPGVFYTQDKEVFMYHSGAAEWKDRLHVGMFVEVEGKERCYERACACGRKHKHYVLIAVHISGAEQIKKKIDLNTPKEDEHD